MPKAKPLKQAPPDLAPAASDRLTLEDFSDESIQQWADDATAVKVEAQPASPESPEQEKTSEAREEEGAKDEAASLEAEKEEAPAPEKEAVEPPFDPSSLNERQKAEWDRQQTLIEQLQGQIQQSDKHEGDLQRRLTDQGRQLAAAEKAGQEKMASYQSQLQEMTDRFEQMYDQSKEEELRWRARTTEISDELDATRQAGDQARVSSLNGELQQARRNANSWEIAGQRLRDQFDFACRQVMSSHTKEMEETLLEQFPEFKHVQDKLEGYCADVGLNPLEIKGDLNRLQRVYSRLLSSERGSAENIEKMREGISKMANQAAARQKAASAPPLGGSPRQESKAAHWSDDLKRPEGKRHDPFVT